MQTNTYPRLIACDLDGTLLNSKKEMSQDLTQTLEALMEQGIWFVPVTGRCFQAVPSQVLSLSGLRYVVTSNGAAADDCKTQKRLFTTSLPSKEVSHLFHTYFPLPILTEVFLDGHAYIDQAAWDQLDQFGLSETSYHYVRRTRKPVEHLPAFVSDHVQELENINLVFRDPALRLQTLSKLQQNPAITVTSSSTANLEITHPCATKGHALQTICNLLHLSPQDVVAFGDSPNDADMLRFTPHSYAMAGGSAEILQTAAHTTSSCDEEGVLVALREIFHKIL